MSQLQLKQGLLNNVSKLSITQPYETQIKVVVAMTQGKNVVSKLKLVILRIFKILRR